jgi:hypothetical protein
MWATWTARNRRSHREITVFVAQACRWAWEMAADLIQTLKKQLASQDSLFSSPPDRIIQRLV